MWAFIAVTLCLFIGLAFVTAFTKRKEISENWSKYKNDPLFMFAAPLFKPDDDPRSRIKFASDNFIDVIMTHISNLFATMLQPMFKIFGVILGSLNETATGLFNIRSLMGNMWNRFREMIDIFMRRFNGVFHQFRLTFAKLLTAMEKTYGVAVSAVYEGLSTIHTITSFIDLMMKVIIVILIILLIIAIFFFFIIAPFSPLIVMVVSIIATTAFAGAVGGMAGTFCFDESTVVIKKSGSIMRLKFIQIGDELEKGGKVLGIMKFKVDANDLYNLYGVTVSSSHIVYIDGKPIHVENHPDAIKIPEKRNATLYCLITSNRKIPVLSQKGTLLFADWEEIETEDDLQTWNKQVYETLNKVPTNEVATEDVLKSEAAISGTNYIETPHGAKLVSNIIPGEFVLDHNGNPTIVTGIVELDSSQIKSVYEYSKGKFISSAAWILNADKTLWIHPKHCDLNPYGETWFNIFTESGSFTIANHEGSIYMRDFTDMGPDHIHETYDWVLKSLEKV